MEIQYHIWAKRSNGEILFYITDDRSDSMTPNAYSHSFRYAAKAEAMATKHILEGKYKGLEFNVSSATNF